MTETELKAVADADLAHVKTVIAGLHADLTHVLEEPKKLEPVLLAAKGWLIATAFIFLVFGIALGHYAK